MQPVISVLAALSILFAAGCSDDGSRGDTANAGGADGEAAGGQGGEAADGEGG